MEYKEQVIFEKLFEMSGGYVLNMSDASLREILGSCAGIDLEEKKYYAKGKSKANRLRCFWEIETDKNVGKSLLCLLEYYDEEYRYGYCDDDEEKEELFKKGNEIAKSIMNGTKKEEIKIEKTNDEKLNTLIDEMNSSLKENRAVGSLDRLHTLLTFRMREICNSHNITFNDKDSLNSLMKRYVNKINEKRLIEHDLTLTMLKQSVSLLGEFNNIRNNYTLVHPNEFLNNEESKLIFRYILATKEFIDKIEEVIKENN